MKIKKKSINFILKICVDDDGDDEYNIIYFKSKINNKSYLNYFLV